MSRITTERMPGVLGRAPKPDAVWQLQFDGENAALSALARRDWDAIAEGDLTPYLFDLTYVELQRDLFRHLFPACLKFWYATLLRNESAERGGADLHLALLRRDLPATMMTEPERGRLLAFFVDGLLDRIDLERGFDYSYPGTAANAWIARFNTLGLIAPIVPQIWRPWWAFETPGQAVSAVEYASGLVYLKGENPIYSPWTPKDGGGGPYLTEWDAQIFDSAWLEENLVFLSETLTCDYVVERLAAAAGALKGESEEAMARRVASDATARTDVISLRIEELLANLARTQLAKERWD